MAKIVRRLSSWASIGSIHRIRDRRDDAAARTAAGFRHEKFVRSYGSEDEGEFSSQVRGLGHVPFPGTGR